MTQVQFMSAVICDENMNTPVMEDLRDGKGLPVRFLKLDGQRSSRNVAPVRSDY